MSSPRKARSAGPRLPDLAAALKVLFVVLLLLTDGGCGGGGGGGGASSGSSSDSFIAVGSMSRRREDHAFAAAGPNTILITGGADYGGILKTTETFDPAVNRFQSAATMVQARSGHTATLLGNGDILMAGGHDNTGALDTAEVFLSASATFSSVGRMTAPRTSHTATMLKDGTVLIAGGSPAVIINPRGFSANINGALDSAEIYQPLQKKFSGSSQAMNTARSQHTATLLNDGKVLLAGGLDNNGAVIASAEIYDPATGNFTLTGSMLTPRFLHSATLLDDGTVLIAGGYNAGILETDSAEIYVPASGKFEPTKGPMTTPRGFQTAIKLHDGDVLIMGGEFNQTDLLSAELYVPATRTFSATGDLKIARVAATATLLNDDQILVAGGGSFDDVNLNFVESFGSAEFYNAAGSPSGALSFMTDPRVGHTATRMANGKVLIAGGEVLYLITPAVLNSTELYHQDTGQFTRGPAMSTTRWLHTATTLKSGQVLVAGGGNASAGDLAGAELYDPLTEKLNPTGSMKVARDGATATLLAHRGAATDGTVLIAGGENHLVPMNEAETYDPSSGSFTPTNNDMAVAHWGHTATLLNDGSVLIAGGLTGGAQIANAELYDPSTRSFTATHPMIVARDCHTATLLNNGQVLIAGGSSNLKAELYNPAKTTFSLTGDMNDIRGCHTAALLTDGRVLIAGGGRGNLFNELFPLNTAEIYDPAAGTFTAVGDLVDARAHYTAGILDDGTVLLVGGEGINSSQATAELFH